MEAVCSSLRVPFSMCLEMQMKVAVMSVAMEQRRVRLEELSRSGRVWRREM
jgi:hypothetical protein